MCEKDVLFKKKLGNRYIFGDVMEFKIAVISKFNIKKLKYRWLWVKCSLKVVSWEIFLVLYSILFFWWYIDFLKMFIIFFVYFYDCFWIEIIILNCGLFEY